MASAQRTSDNVVTQSADAFGKSIGMEKIGLYNSMDVRGFNPVDAGNVRIEGLYFDHIDWIPSKLVEGSTVRVGVAARGSLSPLQLGSSTIVSLVITVSSALAEWLNWLLSAAFPVI